VENTNVERGRDFESHYRNFGYLSLGLEQAGYLMHSVPGEEDYLDGLAWSFFSNVGTAADDAVSVIAAHKVAFDVDYLFMQKPGREISLESMSEDARLIQDNYLDLYERSHLLRNSVIMGGFGVLGGLVVGILAESGSGGIGASLFGGAMGVIGAYAITSDPNQVKAEAAELAISHAGNYLYGQDIVKIIETEALALGKDVSGLKHHLRIGATEPWIG